MGHRRDRADGRADGREDGREDGRANSRAYKVRPPSFIFYIFLRTYSTIPTPPLPPEHEKHALYRVFFVFYGFTSPPFHPNMKIVPMWARFSCSGTSLLTTIQTRRMRPCGSVLRVSDVSHTPDMNMRPQCRVLHVWGVPPPFPPPPTTQTRMFPAPQT